MQDININKTDETGNILSKIICFCSKGQEIIEGTESLHFTTKSDLLTWIHRASHAILENIIPHSFWQQYELDKPKQFESLCSGSGSNSSSIIYLVMWSCFNEACKVHIMKCLKDAEHKTFVIHCQQLQPTDREIWVWLSALVLSAQATVQYGLARLRSEKKKWGSHNALIIKEQILLEACYLSYAVASSFSPAFACYIGTNPNIKGYVNGISIVKMFMSYLRTMSPDVPFLEPFSRMFHCTNLGRSKIGVDWFVKAYINHKSRQNAHSIYNQHSMFQKSTKNLWLRLSQIIKLKEIKTLCTQINEAQKKFLRSKGGGNENIIYLDLDKKSKAALDAIGTDGIDKSEVYFFSTCLAVLTRFVYELLQFQRHGSKERLIGRKMLVKYLVAAFEKDNSMSEGRECLMNVLQSLIKGSDPLFSHEFIASVLQGSVVVTKAKTAERLPPFSIPADDVWNSHFPENPLHDTQRKAVKEEEKEEEEDKRSKDAKLLLNFSSSSSPIKYDQKAKGGNDVKNAVKQKQLEKSTKTKRIMMSRKSNPRLQDQDDLATVVLKRKRINLKAAFDAATAIRTTKMRDKAKLEASNATVATAATTTTSTNDNNNNPNKEQRHNDTQLQKKVRSNQNNAETGLPAEKTKKSLVSGKKGRKANASTKVTKNKGNKEKAEVDEGKKRKWQQKDSGSGTSTSTRNKKKQQLGGGRNKKATPKPTPTQFAPASSKSNRDKTNECLLRRSPRKLKGGQGKESIL